MTWNCFLYCWPYVRGCWTNSWYASGLRCHDSHIKYIQWQESYCGDRMLIRSSHLDNKNSYTGNRESLFWNNSKNPIPIEGTHLLAKNDFIENPKIQCMTKQQSCTFYHFAPLWIKTNALMNCASVGLLGARTQWLRDVVWSRPMAVVSWCPCHYHGAHSAIHTAMYSGNPIDGTSFWK